MQGTVTPLSVRYCPSPELLICTLYILCILYSVTISQACVFQLRYLQTLNNISAEKNSTIVFPVPVDILSSLVSSYKS